jgi:hypothetical protein
MSAQAIQWAALGLCIVCALLRLSDAIRGRGRMIFSAFVLMSIAVGLSLPAIYLPADAALGGRNLANLALRLLLFAVFLLLGVRMAAAFGSPRARRLITGPVGMAALGAAAALTIYFFAVADLTVSSTGLVAHRTEAEVRWYMDVGRSYPAFVAACLVTPALRTAMEPATRPMHRAASVLVGVGFLLVLIHTVIKFVAGPSSIAPWGVLTSFSAVLLVATGLALIWLSRQRAMRS